VKRSALALVLAAALTLAACQDDSANSADEAEPRVERIPMSRIDFGIRKADHGDPRELNRLANIYATMQRRFQAGDMQGVCRYVSDSMLDQFPPDTERTDSSCAHKLDAYAAGLRKQGNPKPRIVVRWIRTYPEIGIGGITGRVGKDAVRVPFGLEDDGWRLQLGVFDRPETLNGTLTAGA
jgi:hypothetical protein